MSRPFRLLLPLTCVLLSAAFNACVGTIYDRTYSYEKTYFKAPPQQKEASAAEILGAVEGPGTVAPGGLPVEAAPGGAAGDLPPPAGDIPGLPPAMPAPDPAMGLQPPP